MQIAVTFRHMEPSEPLRQYVTQKMGKVKKYLREPIDVHCVLSVEKFRHIADVTINSNGVTIKGQEVTEDMYSAIDLVTSKIERQVSRYRDRLKEHKPEGPPPVRVQILPGEEPKVIETESYFLKPMALEEAVMEMDLSTRDFIVFRNSETGRFNVLYRRKDGNYGLIEPEG